MTDSSRSDATKKLPRFERPDTATHYVISKMEEGAYWPFIRTCSVLAKGFSFVGAFDGGELRVKNSDPTLTDELVSDDDVTYLVDIYDEYGLRVTSVGLWWRFEIIHKTHGGFTRDTLLDFLVETGKTQHTDPVLFLEASAILTAAANTRTKEKDNPQPPTDE